MENETKDLSDVIMEAIQDTGDFARRTAIYFLEEWLNFEKKSRIRSEDYLEGFDQAITLLKKLTTKYRSDIMKKDNYDPWWSDDICFDAQTRIPARRAGSI